MPHFTLADVRALGSKLDGLDLTSGEAAVLDTLLGAGDARPEVVGFAGSGAPGAGGYRDRMDQSFSLGFTVEIEGFTAPGDVAGVRGPGTPRG